MKYSTSARGSNEQGRGGWLKVALLVTAGLFVVAGAATALVVVLLHDNPIGIRRSDAALSTAWNAGRYDEVIRTAEQVLVDRPIDGQALTFAGFAYFYAGIDFADTPERNTYLDRAVRVLRKAVHVPRAPLVGQRHYVLGKAYYHSGQVYHDLAIEHLLASLDAGFEADDTRAYLGLAYAHLHSYRESVAWFEAAIERLDGEDQYLLRVQAAESQIALGDYRGAEAQLRQVFDGTEDEFVRLAAHVRLGSVLILDERWAEAEALLLETIENHPESADAHYYLGVVYDRTDRRIEARNLWRTSRAIDPNHTEALRSLANWGN